jgi:hypothetical protein
MIYEVSLSGVAMVLGLVYLLSHGWVAWHPNAARPHLLAAPRHRLLGWLLLGVATLWFATLLARIDLMEYTPHRWKFVLGVLVLGALSARYMEDFLAVRSLGAILILLAQVLLDAAFLRDEPSRLVITGLAYAYIIIGMCCVGAPYWVRDGLGWLCARETRLQRAAQAGVAMGITLLLLGIFVY